MAESIADAFLASASKLPPWPKVLAYRLTFTRYRQVRDLLLEQGSKGAFEQYLLAGLLEQEMEQTRSAMRVETKNVGANDRASKSAGDIELRHKQSLRAAIEVSAAGWENKVDQIAAAADAGLKEVTIAAANVASSASGQMLASALDSESERLGVDVSVVDLHSFMDVVSSRITPHGRMEALHSVHRNLTRYHSREPELAVRLVHALVEFGLADTTVGGHDYRPAESARNIEATMQIIHDGLLEDTDGSIPELLRAIAREMDGMN